MLIRPGRPFWTFVIAFATNMVGLVATDELHLTVIDISVGNWWSATIYSFLVAVIIYGKAKIDEGSSGADGQGADDQRPEIQH